MKLFTIIAYMLSAGSNFIGTEEGKNATEAVVRLREKLQLHQWDLEVVAVVEGRVRCEDLDGTRVALAPRKNVV